MINDHLGDLNVLVDRDVREGFAAEDKGDTAYIVAVRLVRQARQDAKDWMTKYHIEKELAETAEKQRANIMREMTSLTAQRDRAERKNRLLANVIATLIDSEEFV